MILRGWEVTPVLVDGLTPLCLPLQLVPLWGNLQNTQPLSAEKDTFLQTGAALTQAVAACIPAWESACHSANRRERHRAGAGALLLQQKHGRPLQKWQKETKTQGENQAKSHTIPCHFQSHHKRAAVYQEFSPVAIWATLVSTLRCRMRIYIRSGNINVAQNSILSQFVSIHPKQRP